MRTRSVFSAVVALGLSLGAGAAQALTASISATATVLQAITVSPDNALDFGNVTPGVNRTVAPSDAGAGRFTITKAAGTGLSLSFVLPANLVSGGNNLAISGWTGAWNTSATPTGATSFTPSASAYNTGTVAGSTVVVYVGATVQPTAAQAAGSYSGSVQMTAVYF